MGPKSYFEIEVLGKGGSVLTSYEVHFVALAENLTASVSPILSGKQNSLTDPLITGSFEKRAPGQEHCVVYIYLGKTLYSDSASLHPGV